MTQKRKQKCAVTHRYRPVAPAAKSSKKENAPDRIKHFAAKLEPTYLKDAKVAKIFKKENVDRNPRRGLKFHFQFKNNKNCNQISEAQKDSLQWYPETSKL